MHCPHCGQVRVCRVVPTTELGKPQGQRWYRPDHQDIQWFRRARKCLKCGKGFITAEVIEGFLEELVQLRNALANIKKNAEDYVQESAAASAALGRLTESLGVLRALKVYQRTPTESGEPSDWEKVGREYLQQGMKIHAIKLVREAKNCDIMEALDIVNSWQ